MLGIKWGGMCVWGWVGMCVFTKLSCSRKDEDTESGRFFGQKLSLSVIKRKWKFSSLQFYHMRAFFNRHIHAHSLLFSHYLLPQDPCAEDPWSSANDTTQRWTFQKAGPGLKEEVTRGMLRKGSEHLNHSLAFLTFEGSSHNCHFWPQRSAIPQSQSNKMI